MHTYANKDFDRIADDIRRAIGPNSPAPGGQEISDTTLSIAEMALGVLPDDYELSGMSDDAIMRDAMFSAGVYGAAFGKSGDALRNAYFQAMTGAMRQSSQSAENGRAEYKDRMANAWKKPAPAVVF